MALSAKAGPCVWWCRRTAATLSAGVLVFALLQQLPQVEALDVEKPKPTKQKYPKCNWVGHGLSGPVLTRPMKVRFVYKQWGSAGATSMRGRQIARILDTHPNITVHLLRVRDCRTYCRSSPDKDLSHVIYVKYPCPSCARHRGIFRALDVVDNIGFLRSTPGSLPRGFSRPGTYSSLIVNTHAMAADAKKLMRQRSTVIEHQHNNFCNITATFKTQATEAEPFKVYFIGGRAGSLSPMFSELKGRLSPTFPHLIIEGTQVSGSTLREDFRRLSTGDVAVVWDQCKGTRFNPSDCRTYKPNTRAAAAMSTGLPVILYGKYSGHQELVKQFGVTAELSEALLPNTVTKLAKSIKLLLGDPEIRHKLATRSKQISERYSIQSIAQQYVSLLASGQ